MKTFSAFAILLAALPLSAVAQTDRVFGWGIDQRCYDAANQAAALWAQQGIATPTIQKQFQQFLARCSGADAATAAFVGAVNVEYYRLARLIVSGQIAPDLYVGLVRDRERKMRHAVKDTLWLNAYTMGDADGDLIPDAMDRCPGTPDLTRTDDQGCPDATPLPPQVQAEVLHTVFNEMHLMTSPACDAAPLPDVSTPIKLGFNNGPIGNGYAPDDFLLAVTKVAGQPANCVVLYELQVQMQGVINPLLAPPSRLETVVFRSTENTDMGPTGQHRQIFRVGGASTGIKYQLWKEVANYTDFQFRARAVNGNGQSSGWSEWVKSAGGFGAM